MSPARSRDIEVHGRVRNKQTKKEKKSRYDRRMSLLFGPHNLKKIPALAVTLESNFTARAGLSKA